VNGALLSRMRVYALQALTTEEIGELLRRASEVEVEDEAIEFLAARSEGDARTALNALELALATAAESGGRVTLALVEDALQRRAVLFDKKGDRHYDYISAWIKATRGSDPDASLYYLAVMLEGGEDPRFIVRRMVILASEDIGNADPGALSVANAAAQAVERVGLPEARYALAQAAIYLALAPKSDAAGRALSAAEAHVRERGAAPVPGWLRPGARPGQQTGGYDSPHNRPGHVSPQELLPESVVGERFYEPDEAEAQLAQRLAEIRRARRSEER
jgi:putative ATPase